MNIFTTTVLDKGNFICTHRGWSFSRSSKLSLEEFYVKDIYDNTRFFNITSLQSIGDGMVNDGFFKKQYLSLVKDQYPETNEPYILIALVVDGYIDIPERYFARRIVKSPVLRNGSLAMIVIHLDKREKMSFRVKDGEQIVRNLTLRYNSDHHSVEVYDQSKELVLSTSFDPDIPSFNPISRLFRFIKSIIRKTDLVDR